MHESLPARSEAMREEAETSQHRSATTMMKGEGPLKQVLIHLRPDGELPAHDNPGDASLYIVEGEVRFTDLVDEVTHTLRAGDLFEIPRHRHEVRAVSAATLLLSFVTAPR